MRIRQLTKIAVLISIAISSVNVNAVEDQLMYEDGTYRYDDPEQPIYDPIEPTKDPVIDISIIKGISFSNGRLVFASKEALQAKVDYMKTVDKAVLSDALYFFYNQGFKPLIPLYHETDLLNEDSYEIRKVRAISGSYLSEAQILTVATDDDLYNTALDDTDDVISDDIFGAVLNEKREIQVGDRVYKYDGSSIYHSKLTDVDKMYEYLAQKGISKDAAFRSADTNTLQKSSSEQIVSSKYAIDYLSECDQPYEEVRYEEVVYEYNSCSGGGGGSSGGSTGGSSGSGTTGTSYYDQLAQQYLDSIGYCNPSNATFPFFGTTKKCISKFSSRYRVKTKFWNTDYLVYKSIGIFVKHQKRKFGIWWTRSTDEIRLGINQVYFEYDLPVPDYSIFDHTRFIFKNKIYDGGGNYVGAYTGSNDFPFNSSNFDTVQIIRKFPLTNTGFTLTPEFVNQQLFSGLWSTAKSIASSNGHSNMQSVVMTGYTDNKVIVNYVDKSFRKYNSKKIKKVFDWQIGFGVTIGLDAHGGASFKPNIPNLYDYKNAKIDIYGIARRGSTWKGSKLKYIE